ncbi:MAG: short-chain dehydrogenase, partial [SAR116 cluster bacterium MED-G04]
MKTVFITGTNKGLGLEFSKQYLNEGHAVIATCRNPDQAAELNALHAMHPGKLTILKMDLSDEASIQRIGHDIKDRPVDIFISNAGTATGYASEA